MRALLDKELKRSPLSTAQVGVGARARARAPARGASWAQATGRAARLGTLRPAPAPTRHEISRRATRARSSA